MGTIDIKTKLQRLPRLSDGGPEIIPCKICGSSALHFDTVDFHKFCDMYDYYKFGFSGVSVPYFRCRDCDFLFTPFFDHWSVDDFRSFIYNDDYAIIDADYLSVRPSRTAEFVAHGLKKCRSARILDYGSGNGTFIDALRAHGFAEATGYDPVSWPQPPNGRFDIVFAFETLEHSPTPLQTFCEIFSFLDEGGCFIFSQCTQPRNIATTRGSWWYIAPRNGHVSTYSLKTLSLIADRFHLDFYQIDETVFAFGPRMLSSMAKAALKGFGCFEVPTALDLLAPGPDVPHPGWHDLEFSGTLTRFRWTAAPSIVWSDLVLTHRSVSLRVPVVNQIEPAFAAKARLLFDQQELPTTFDGTSLTASIKPQRAGTVCTIELRTPPLKTPRSVNGTHDDRMLGIAVAAK